MIRRTVRVRAHATKDETLGAHASCALLVGQITGRLEACVPRDFQENR